MMCTDTIWIFLIIVASVFKVYAEYTTVCRHRQISQKLCPGDDVLDIEDVVGGRDKQKCAVAHDFSGCTYTYPRDSAFYRELKAACDGTKDCGILEIGNKKIMCDEHETDALFFIITFKCVRPTLLTDPPKSPTTLSTPTTSSLSTSTSDPSDPSPSLSTSPQNTSTVRNGITTSVTPSSTSRVSNTSSVTPTSSMYDIGTTTPSPPEEVRLVVIICVVAGAVLVIVIIVIIVCVLRRKRDKGTKSTQLQMTETEHTKPSATADPIANKSTYEEKTVFENNQNDSEPRHGKINGLTKSSFGYDEVDFPFYPAAAAATTENESESPGIGHDMTYDDVIHGETNSKRASVDDAIDRPSNEASDKSSDVYAQVRNPKASNGNAIVNVYGEVNKPKVTKKEDKFEDTELVDNTLYDFGP